jgi:CDP-glycerol glycerophosphotransferase
VLGRVCYRYRRSRAGSFMAEVSDRHFDMFATYETIYRYVSDLTLAPAVRAALFARTIRHYVFALPKVPKSSRRDFFSRMTRDFRRWRPEEFTLPAGPLGIELRLIGRGAYGAYNALIPLNRVRLALRQRLR